MTAFRVRYGVAGIILLVSLIGTGCGGTGAGSPTPAAGETAATIQQQLAAALRPVDEQYAQLTAESPTKVETYPAPFLTQYQIYRVEHLNPNKPIVFYVGYAPGEKAYVLTGSPPDMIDLAKADGVVIDSPETAEGYAAAFLEVTRSMAELFYVVESVEDIQFRPNLTPEEERVKAAFAEEYRTIIEPATATPAEGGYLVTVYAVREQTLERHEVGVSTDGAVTEQITVLERDLPLVYGL
jgi:hypothetical protein